NRNSRKRVSNCSGLIGDNGEAIALSVPETVEQTGMPVTGGEGKKIDDRRT
ncbi:MAG: hypothetical protein F6K35_29360, partial [Okeania sp. SIO2H7]|nr:hypothetical protein [Okeania sp. SIO2H7]